MRWTPENFKKWALAIGPETLKLVGIILSSHAHRELGFRTILGLQRLERKYDSIQLEAAAAVANERRVPTQRFVRGVLERQAVTGVVSPTPEPEPLVHSNLRGEKFYH